MAGKFKRRHVRGVTDAVVFVLAHGVWFFRKADFSWDDWPVAELRQTWRDPAVRERVHQRYRDRKFSGVPFAEIAFGEDGRGGMVKIDVDLPAARDEYRLQREIAFYENRADTVSAAEL